MGNKIPDWYKEMTKLAKSYYTLLHMRSEIEKDVLLGSSGPADGMPRTPSPGDPTARKAELLIRTKEEADAPIRAMQAAMDNLWDEKERQFIRLNLYQQIPMHWINIPIPIITMKRIRSRFLRDVARRLGKIP